MSFLAPLFLIGGLAIGLPILFHLIRQTTRDRTVFSSLFLLEPTPPRLTRRSRLSNILLLVLRCTVLVLLAFAFARPFLSTPVTEPPATGPGRVLILLDTSASMRRAGVWEQARKDALEQVRRASAADQLAIYAFDRDVRPVLSFDEWTQTPPGQRVSVAEARVSGLAPGWAASRAGAALQQGAELLADTGRSLTGGRKELVLVSDLQEGSRFESIQGYEWPKDVRVTVAEVKPARSSNAAMQLVPDDLESTDYSSVRPIRFRVMNSPDSNREQFKAAWLGPANPTPVLPPIDVYVPSGQGRTFTIPVPEGTNKPTRLVLLGDQEPYDNTVYVVRPEPAKATVLYLGQDARPVGEGASQQSLEDPKAPLYFLRRAFSASGARETTIITSEPGRQLDRSQLENASLLIATHLEPGYGLDSLREAVTAGKTLFVSAQNASLGPGLVQLLKIPRLDLSESKPGFAMLTEVDFKHPLFALFADPRYADFSKVRFWTYQRIDSAQIPGSRVLARFDTGDPAMLEVPLGRGRVIILAAGWQPERSQLALSTKFVPLLHTLLEQSGDAPPPATALIVGDNLPAPAIGRQGSEIARVIAPDGVMKEISTANETPIVAAMPGVYEVQSGGATSRFAVNIDPAESRPGRMSLEDLEKLGAPVQATPLPTEVQLAARQERLKSGELENRQKLWRYVVLAALAVLFAETWLSGRTTRRILLQGAST